MKDIIEIGVFITRVLFISGIPFVKRVDLVMSAFISLFRLVIFKQKKVRYFGNDFIHESIVGPVLIYPHEISTHLIKQISGEKLKYVLDIGGNLGQFSITLGNMVDLERIYILEPNVTIFDALESNCSNYEQIKCYNVAIGKPGKKKFYYEVNKSATGSFIKDNASLRDGTLKQLDVKTTDDVYSLTGRSAYDLIKIDVEGFEMEVVKNLKGIKTKYLLIEVSSNREKNYSTSELYSQIAKTFGEFEVIYQDASDSQTNSYDVLLRIIE